MKNILLKYVLILLMVFVSFQTMAALLDIGGGGLPDQEKAWFADVNYPSIGDDFSLSTAVTVSEITFWGIYIGGNVDGSNNSFSVELFGLDNNLYTSIYSETALALAGDNGAGLSVSFGPNDFDLYQYSIFVDISLDVGDYILSISNDTSGYDANWLWATSCVSDDPQDCGGGMLFVYQSANWIERNYDQLAFQFYGDVGSTSATNLPEASTGSLLLFILSGALFLVMRHNKACRWLRIDY